MNERHRGYGAFQFAKVPVIGPFTGFLDGHRGLSPWHHRFPLVMLRMISFSMDRSWATFYPRVGLDVAAQPAQLVPLPTSPQAGEAVPVRPGCGHHRVGPELSVCLSVCLSVSAARSCCLSPLLAVALHVSTPLSPLSPAISHSADFERPLLVGTHDLRSCHL